MNKHSIINLFVGRAFECAITNSQVELDIGVVDEDAFALMSFALDHKVEGILSNCLPVLKPVDELNKLVYATQVAWLEANKKHFSQIGSFTLIQGFTRNDGFLPFMPPGRRSDIDFCIDDADAEALEKLLFELGFRQTAIIDGKLVELDKARSNELQKTIGYAYPKETPYTLPLNFTLPVLEDFEIGDAFGALRTFNGETKLLLILERTISFADENDSIFINLRNRVFHGGLSESDDHVFALAAALRFVKGTLNAEPRFRAGLEFIYSMARPKFGFDANELLRLADEYRMLDVIASTCAIIGGKSVAVAEFFHAHGLPSSPNKTLLNAFDSQLSRFDGLA